MDDILVFFDGKCLFCNNQVRFLLKRDKNQRFKFAPLQGITASQKLPPELINDLNSMVVLQEQKNYLRMDAVILCLKNLKGFWRAVGYCLGIIPRGLRNLIYDFFAQNRYRWFGELSECQLLTAEEKSRFLP